MTARRSAAAGLGLAIAFAGCAWAPPSTAQSATQPEGALPGLQATAEQGPARVDNAGASGTALPGDRQARDPAGEAETLDGAAQALADRPGRPDLGAAVRRSIVALGIVLTLIALAAVVAPRLWRKRWARRAAHTAGIEGASEGLRVDHAINLERGRRMYVLNLDGRRFLLGSSERGLGPCVPVSDGVGPMKPVKRASTEESGPAAVSFEAALRERPTGTG
ncbi:MAG: hypothetical protein AAF288_12805 [Planctomycetota bacterium]